MTPRLEARPGLRLLSYLALLPATAVELEAAADRAVADNPFLERRPWRTCPGCGLATTDERCTACGRAHWTTEPESTPDWREELLRDAAAELPTRLRAALDLVVACLDDHGMLTSPPDLPTESTSAVVAGLRLVGPPGIAATSALDCVRVQAGALAAAGIVPGLVADLADRWLPEVAEERFADIAAATGSTERDVIAAAGVLRERTRPFVSLPGRAPRSAPTDVVFTLPDRDGPVVARVAEPASVGLGLVPDALVDDADARAWAAPHRDAAHRLLAAIAARGQMLRRVADELARAQRDFIVDGPAAHRPLLRQDVAATLSVHPSTVGRVVTGKVARCPDGRLVPLGQFFGTVRSTHARVAAAIEAHPHATDRQVAELLALTGRPIARRTVAKYRALGPNLASPDR
jgi:RNA polymerase sigma-54 factor